MRYVYYHIWWLATLPFLMNKITFNAASAFSHVFRIIPNYDIYKSSFLLNTSASIKNMMENVLAVKDVLIV